MRFENEKEIYKQVANKHKCATDEMLCADNDKDWKEAVMKILMGGSGFEPEAFSV